MNHQDNPLPHSGQFPIDLRSPTPLIDAIQFAQAGYEFSEEEIDLLGKLIAGRQADHIRERRLRMRSIESPDPLTDLTSSIKSLITTLEDQQQGEVPYQAPQRPERPTQPLPTPLPQVSRTSSPAIAL